VSLAYSLLNLSIYEGIGIVDPIIVLAIVAGVIILVVGVVAGKRIGEPRLGRLVGLLGGVVTAGLIFSWSGFVLAFT
jgi:hypothetical protein